MSGTIASYGMSAVAVITTSMPSNPTIPSMFQALGRVRCMSKRQCYNEVGCEELMVSWFDLWNRIGSIIYMMGYCGRGNSPPKEKCGS